MAGSLIKIDEFSISSAVSSVILGGGSSGSSGLNVSIDSTYDVYLFTWVGVTCSNDTQQNLIRITKSGSADTTANYDFAQKILYSTTSFFNNAQVNQTAIASSFQGTATGESQNGSMYLYNFNNSSEFSFGTQEDVALTFTPRVEGNMGGFVHTVASASDGIQYFMAVGNLTGGKFTLYGLNK